LSESRRGLAMVMDVGSLILARRIGVTWDMKWWRRRRLSFVFSAFGAILI
jgi:hypothetical protein